MHLIDLHGNGCSSSVCNVRMPAHFSSIPLYQSQPSLSLWLSLIWSTFEEYVRNSICSNNKFSSVLLAVSALRNGLKKKENINYAFTCILASRRHSSHARLLLSFAEYMFTVSEHRKQSCFKQKWHTIIECRRLDHGSNVLWQS